MQGLNWTPLHIPFSAGLQQRADDRARPTPYLDIAKDIQFDEEGGVQTRLPYTALGVNIAGGGVITNPRRLVAFGDELLLFTSTALYSWDATHVQWALKGTHLAIAATEDPKFVTTGDQITADRAQLSGTIVYAWVEASSTVYVAAVDSVTGSMIMAPTAIAGTGTRPRLVALSTKILLFYLGNLGSFECYALDPANPATALAGASTTILSSINANLYYDAVKVPGADTAVAAIRRTVTTSYTIATVTAGLIVTTSTKARTCDGPIAVSCEPTGTSVQVIRANATNIQGDRITIAGLVDAATGQAIGTALNTPINQIAAAHRSVQNGGAYRCYAFWSAQETNGSLGFECKTNYVDTGGGLGAQSVLRLRLGVASRAFDYNGEVYVWLAFAGESGPAGVGVFLGERAQLQNAYFLYRDDGHLAGRCVAQVGGGFSAATGHLPSVALTAGSTSFSWCAIRRRRIVLGGNDHSGYAARSPIDVTFTFDANIARRCVRFGRTLYIAGTIVLQYDGRQLVELGFLIFPWLITSVPVGGGAIPAGKYSYKATERWDNAQGERERSTTATGEQVTNAGAQKILYQIASLHVTRKASTPAIEMWRTKVGPADDASYFLASSVDPASVAGDNAYITNADSAAFTATFTDNMLDGVLETKEGYPEGLIELSPPGASIIAATSERVFLAGIPGDADRVWYSKQRVEGQLAAFHGALVIDVPRDGGRITAIAATEGGVIVWRETASYEFGGYGFDNAGGGSNYALTRVLSPDVGAESMEGVARVAGGFVFKSSKGWHFQPFGGPPQYIGQAVSDYDDEAALAISVLEAQHQVRVLTASRMIGFDVEVKQWFEWTITNGLDAAMWRGSHVYLDGSAGVMQQGVVFSGLTYGLDVETAWIKPADLQGSVRIRRLLALGEWRSTHGVRVRVAYNYRVDAFGNPLYVDDFAWAANAIDPGDVEQIQIGPSDQQCQAIKVRLTAEALGTILTTALSGLVTLDVGSWTATLNGLAPATFSIGFDSGPSDPLVVEIEVRDHEHYDAGGGGWTVQRNNCGVRVGCNTTTAKCTMALLEAAINASSRLVAVSPGHATPSRFVDPVVMEQLTRTGSLPVAFPAGEALKLTGLALELGAKPGIYRRIAANQKAG